MEDIIKEFLVESHENLDLLDRALVDLEKNPTDRGNLGQIFRTIHTIKGTCGFLGFGTLESVSHVGENLLSRLRDGDLVLDGEITTGLLKMVDAIRQILASIEQTEGEGQADYSELIALLGRLNAPAGTAPAAVETARPAPAAEPVSAAELAPVPPPAPAPVAVTKADVAGMSAGDDRRPGVSDTSLRVDVGLLDKLMNLVGELVLARNQIVQYTATQTDSAFAGATQRLNLVTSELQEGVMKTRMQPIDNVWSKFPRVVRDLATACNKRVRIEMVGRDTELDKTIIEAIKDPLTHVVRNSVDHGIEDPDVRVAGGKSPEGLLTLRAFHQGGQINIEITDDGAGIDPEKIRRKSVERALVTSEQATRMSDHEALRMIFLPGFSTAAAITNVSGRGVGMDVVKTNIEKIGGTVDIQSRVGLGTTLQIRIPLTLAIIPALVVSTDHELFAIPQVSLLELVRLEGPQARAGIERIGSASFHRLRGNLLPLVYLHEELGLTSRCGADVVNIVVLKADDLHFGLVVDAVNDTEEIVVKPLGKLLKSVQVFAGATIMGDGHVALILDVVRLAQQAHVMAETRDEALGETRQVAVRAEAGDVQSWLLFTSTSQERVAIPLRMVARLEEFSPDVLERSSGLDVVQYRGEILPLITFGAVPCAAAEDSRQVIVFTDQGRSIGLVVDQILDIVNEAIQITPSGRQPGVIGSAVIQGRVTDVLDLSALSRLVLAPTATAA